MKNNRALIVEKISFTLVEIKTKNTIPYTVSVGRDTSAQNVEKKNEYKCTECGKALEFHVKSGSAKSGSLKIQ